MVKKGQKSKGTAKNERKARIQRENEYLKDLEARVHDFAEEDAKKAAKFEDLPLSKNTLEGLRSSHFAQMTDIQKRAILPALRGNDILGAARTGSGKTLAFLIPVLDLLYRKKWNQFDGLGALIISPTRELAIQIFQVLRKIGRGHQLSAGLVIGGKDVAVEAERLSRLNILIGTPGRILQHMDQTAGFDTTNLQLLVLDEADRILDMGFKKTLDAIIDNLPPHRQSLLFSATQTKSVADLARLSLSDPTYISVHEDVAATPKALEQYYIVTELWEKIDTLFGFLRSHTKTKILVFMSSSKQVRYLFETFRRLQPGVPLLHLHGRQKQQARIDVTTKFSNAQHSCLFATDIVARGIDFPAVDWVIQLDAPEDVATYIHRVGRSARFDKKGRALMFLTPSEEPGMLAALATKKLPVEKLTIKEAKKKSVRDKMQAMCFKDPEIKYLGQKAFISYVRSVYVQKDKEVFKVENIDYDKFAESLGLPGAPKVKIHGGQKSKEIKNAPRALVYGEDDDEDGEGKPKEKEKVRTKYDRMFERKNQNVLSEHYLNLTKGDGKDNDSDEEFMSVKRKDHALENGEVPAIDSSEPVSKRSAKRALSKKLSLKDKPNPTKLVFDDEGEAHPIYEFQDEEDFRAAGDADTQKAEFLSKEREAMQQHDVEDKALAREKRQEKKRKRLEALRRAQEEDDESDVPVVLGGGDDEDDDEDLPDLDRDMQHSSDDEERAPKRTKRWFEKDNDDVDDKDSGVLEVDQLDTLEDLESLSTRLIRGR